jgi:uncharacterized protein YbbK (DUF523 family)
MAVKPNIGISACLLGRKVRYDGGHKRQARLVQTLARQANLLPVCPETECGLGVPRAPMRLAGPSAAPRLVIIRTGQDVTSRMRRWLRRELAALCTAHLAGFVFKSKSPSCGLARVKIFDRNGKPMHRGAGLFARAVRARFPGLPVSDERKLADPRRRRAFLRRVLACHHKHK